MELSAVVWGQAGGGGLKTLEGSGMDANDNWRVRGEARGGRDLLLGGC